MQVTKISPPIPEFEPIVVQITIETPQERKVLYEMLGYNLSIPDMVYSNQAGNEVLLREVMTKIRNAL